MTVAETSVKSYMELKDTGELTDQQREVLQMFINEMPCTRNEVAEKYGWKNGTISGRTKELVNKEFLQCIGKRPDHYTGRQVEVFLVNTDKVETGDVEEESNKPETGDVIFE